MTRSETPSTTSTTYSGQYLKRNIDPKTKRRSWYFRVDPRHRPDEWTERFGASIRLPRDTALRTGRDERIDPTEYAAAYREAEALYATLCEMRGQSGEQVYPRGSMRWTVDRWLKSPGFADMADTTQDFYRLKLKHVLEWTDRIARKCGGVHHHIRIIDVPTVERFLATYDDQETLRGHLKATLSLIWQTAVSAGEVDRNIIRDVSVRRRKRGITRKTSIHLWDQTFVNAFAAIAQREGRPEAAALVLTMWDVGQRASDLLKLTALSEMEHEALKRGILDPGFYYDPFDAKLVGWQNKTGAFIDIPLDAVTIEALKQVAPGPRENRRHVFAVPSTGEPFSLTTFSRLFRDLADKIGYTRHTFRQGRHSAIVRMLEADIADSLITAISGHDNPDTLRKRYAVGTSAMAAEAKRKRAEHEANG